MDVNPMQPPTTDSSPLVSVGIVAAILLLAAGGALMIGGSLLALPYP